MDISIKANDLPKFEAEGYVIWNKYKEMISL